MESEEAIPRGLNKGSSSKFRVGSRVRQGTPEEGRTTYRPKYDEYKYEDEDNYPKTLNDKTHQASSQKFRQMLPAFFPQKYIIDFKKI